MKTTSVKYQTKKDCLWYRNWIEQFPIGCQNQVVNNKKVDIKTPNNLVIQFQHSNITPERQKDIETMYKDMLWVVDGTRLKTEYSRFEKGIKEYSKELFKFKGNFRLLAISSYDKVLPKNWINCSFPVVFDFLGESDKSTAFQKNLYFLLPRKEVKPDENSAYLFCLPRKNFSSFVRLSDWTDFYPKLLSTIAKIQTEQ